MARAINHLLLRRTPLLWRAADDDNLLRLVRFGVTWPCIAERMGRSEAACRERHYVLTTPQEELRARAMRRINQPPPPRKLADHEVELVRRLVALRLRGFKAELPDQDTD